MSKSKSLMFIFSLLFLSMTISMVSMQGSCSESLYVPALNLYTYKIDNLYQYDEIQFKGTSTGDLSIFLLDEENYLALLSSEDEEAYYLEKTTGTTHDFQYSIPVSESGDYYIVMFNLNLFQVQIVYELSIISPTTIVVVLVVIVVIGALIFGFWKKSKAIVFMPPNIPSIPLLACQYCKQPLEKSYKICPNCGKPVISSNNSVVCPKCHQQVPYPAIFCQQCGFEFGKQI